MYIVCELGGMPDNQLQMLQIFVMNRIVTKLRSKQICETLQICFKLPSLNDKGETRTETIGDKSSAFHHIGLTCEHDLITEKTSYPY